MYYNLWFLKHKTIMNIFKIQSAQNELQYVMYIPF